MNREEQGKKMGEVIKKAWSDEAFKERLLKDATAVLKEEGVEVPTGLEVRAVENTDKLFHLVLPPRRSFERLTDAHLDSVAGGAPQPYCNLDVSGSAILMRCGSFVGWVYNEHGGIR
ncbi:MAG: NHLP leader peptide family RiPP precursor [Syntrophales bacterium LBB04]|nr:NHLP leader peptide family RiPP precursor [Syntrophales bacterium LBB04]